MALFDSADLLARCKRSAGLPAQSDFPVDADWFAWLTEAENDWKATIASQVPKSQWGDPALMTTADGGASYTVSGVDEFLGPVEIRQTLRGTPIGPDEYLIEGATIRWPFGTERAFAAGPYIRYATPSAGIDAGTEPTLNPSRARMLLVYGALKRYGATAGAGLVDPGYWERMESLEWFGDGGTRTGLLQNLMDVYMTTDAELDESSSPWWRGPDLRQT